MTIDENPYAEPEWLRIARRQEAEHAAVLEAEWRDREACESIEARETYWAGVMAAMPDHVRRTMYQGSHR